MFMKKCCGVHALRIAVGITMLALLLAGSANAATLTVCHSECAYSSIQKAIKASSSGDTILVKSGTYFENVEVNKKLILRGIGNPVVDAGESGSAITLSADGTTLEGFTATGSGFEEAGINVTSRNNTLSGNNASNNAYSGISLSSSSKNTLNGNNANSNKYHGIYLLDSSNNNILGNIANSNNNYGIDLESSSSNTLSRNNASNNNNYGIYMDSSSNNKIYNNIFNNTNNFNTDFRKCLNPHNSM
jgi:parallel beta-helix repeat protein